MHTPLLQGTPVGQALPHLPQFLGSFWLDRHLPAQQISPGEQVLPQFPQFLTS
jgi:hypothetical protein